MQCVGQRYYQRKDVEFPNGEKLLKEWIRAENGRTSTRETF